MLSRTTRMHKQSNQFLTEQCDNQVTYLQQLKQKVETILQQIILQKKILEDRYTNQRKILLQKIQEKDGEIQKLQIKVRQLQKENEQIRYQYEQRVSLMNILKQQNWIVSKQFSQEKDRMQSIIEYLTRQNQSLKESIIKNTYRLEDKLTPYTKTFGSPKKYTDFVKQPQFYSMTDLKSKFSIKNSQKRLRISKYNESQDNQQSIDHSISRSSMVQALKKRGSQFAQSRITQAKPTNKWKQCGLQRMSAITYLSREDN